MKRVYLNYSNKGWINVHDPLEVQYWSNELNVPAYELLTAVDEIGSDVASVKLYLQNKQRRRVKA